MTFKPARAAGRIWPDGNTARNERLGRQAAARSDRAHVASALRLLR